MARHCIAGLTLFSGARRVEPPDRSGGCRRAAATVANAGDEEQTMNVRHGLLAALVLLALWPPASPAEPPVAHAAATCSGYPNQAAAQRAADTRDADGDGIYCVIYSG
jgi:hypothetical protein